MYALYNIQEQHISAALKPANIVFHSLLVFREFSQWYSDEVASRLFTNHVALYHCPKSSCLPLLQQEKKTMFFKDSSRLKKSSFDRKMFELTQ